MTYADALIPLVAQLADAIGYAGSDDVIVDRAIKEIIRLKAENAELMDQTNRLRLDRNEWRHRTEKFAGEQPK